MPLSGSISPAVKDGQKLGVAIGDEIAHLQQQNPRLWQALTSLQHMMNTIINVLRKSSTLVEPVQILTPSGQVVATIGGPTSPTGITIQDLSTQQVAFLGAQQDVIPLSVTAATNASPSVLTVPGNTYLNGDTLFIVGMLGNTSPNGHVIVENVGIAGAGTFTLTDLNGTAINGNGAYGGGGTATRYYGGLLTQTMAIGPSFSNYKLRAFADGSLHIQGATIDLKSAGGEILLDPSAPAIDVYDSGGNLIAWMGKTGGDIGLWSKSLWAGGTGTANAPFKVDASGKLSISMDSTSAGGSPFTLNLAGVTTTISNSSGIFGTAGLRVQNNVGHNGVTVEDSGVFVYDTAGAPLVECVTSANSGNLNVFTQGGAGAIINTDGVYQLGGTTVLSKSGISTLLQTNNVWSLGPFKTGGGGTAGASGTFKSGDAVPKTITVTNGIITSIV